MPAKITDERQAGSLVLLCVGAWLIPGAGHVWLGRRGKGLVFLLAIAVMFGIGVLAQGRLFPLDFSDPFIGLMAAAQLGAGAPRFVAGVLGSGAGDITAVSYEYGNTFLIVAGLLNCLIVIDAYDIAVGRK